MMTDESPAVRLINAKAYEIWLCKCKDLTAMDDLRQNTNRIAILFELNRLVKLSATMSEVQGETIANHIIGQLVGRDSFPPLPELLAIATYINSCS